MQLFGISSVFIHFTKRQNRLSKHTKDLFTRPFLHHNLPMKVCQHFMYVISMTSCKVPVIQRAAVRRLEDTARSHLQVWYTCQYNQQSHRATTSPHQALKMRECGLRIFRGGQKDPLGFGVLAVNSGFLWWYSVSPLHTSSQLIYYRTAIDKLDHIYIQQAGVCSDFGTSRVEMYFL